MVQQLAMTAQRVVEMATLGGARSIGLDREIGALTVGMRADIAIFSLRGASIEPVHEPVSSLVYTALGNEARTVIVDGRIVMLDGRLVGLDEAAVLDRAGLAASGLARRAGIPIEAPWSMLPGG